MKKSVVVILIVAGVIVIGTLAIGTWMIFSFVSHFDRGHSNRPMVVTVPKERSTNSLAVFNFKGSGNADANDYAAGFARALAERLSCAPTCVTHQLDASELLINVCNELGDPLTVPTFDQAVTMGRSMGTRYVVIGEMKIVGDSADISILVCDSYDSNKKTDLLISGPISDLGSLQTKAVDGIIAAMKLKPSSRQLRELRTPNFTNNKTILLYGRSMREKDASKRLAMRWKMVESDSKSSFAVLRLLGYYKNSDLTAPQIVSDKKLQNLLTDLPHLFPDNSMMNWYRAMLLVRQFKYEQAERECNKLIKTDRDFANAHAGLAYVARLRQNGKLAIREGKSAVRLWPDNAYLHALLACDYDTAANNARHGHYIRNMDQKMYSDWESNSYKRIREALISVKMNPNLYLGWQEILAAGLELGRYDDRDRAYKELIRINPKDTSTYIEYGRGFLPQWGGTRQELEKVFIEADRAFGVGSTEACYVRASLLMCQSDHSKDWPEIKRLVDLGIKSSKTPHYGLLLKKCTILDSKKTRGESLKLAQQCYKRWGSLDWSDQLAGVLSAKYYDERKMDCLRQAYSLYSNYAREVPYDPYAHCHVGWCLSHLGRREEAKKEFLRALELDPTNEMAKEKMKYVE
jgi:tetratricopeptide (TPR) repeat protein